MTGTDEAIDQDVGIIAKHKRDVQLSLRIRTDKGDQSSCSFLVAFDMMD